VLIADGTGGRTDVKKVLEYVGERKYLSLMVEAGSKVNWTMLDSNLADKVLFYYAPKILGGLKSLPVAGGQGRMRRSDAILLDRLKIHAVSTNEFAVEAYVVKQ
jgi:diaminohydroxyphosphoribosylaminopyrimidine deaminase/5-amino-6-(5-phosphoribosylamino)uracil reductase